MDAISCLAPHAILSHSLADAAIARALHISLSDSSAAAAPHALLNDLAFPAAPCEPAEAHAETPRATGPTARGRLPPAGGRAGKRRPRPSKRAPTTYISTDTANFRLMVQQITGAQAVPVADSLLLPAFDAFGVPADAAAAAPLVSAYGQPAPATDNGTAGQPSFPTLDSWSVLYGRNEMV